MKKLASFILCLGIVFSAFAKNADQMFEDFVQDYRNSMYINYTYISKIMMNKVDLSSLPAFSKMSTFTDKNMRNKFSSIQTIQVYNKNKRFLQDIVTKVTSSGYDRLLRLQSSVNAIEIYFHPQSKDRDGTSPASIILVNDDNNYYTVIVFTGSFTLEDIMKSLDVN